VARFSFIIFLIAYLADIVMNFVLAAGNLPTVVTVANGSLVRLLAASLGEVVVLWIHGFVIGVIFFWIRRKSKSRFKGIVASTITITIIATVATLGAFHPSDHRPAPLPAMALRSSIG